MRQECRRRPEFCRHCERRAEFSHFMHRHWATVGRALPAAASPANFGNAGDGVAFALATDAPVHAGLTVLRTLPAGLRAGSGH